MLSIPFGLSDALQILAQQNEIKRFPYFCLLYAHQVAAENWNPNKSYYIHRK